MVPYDYSIPSTPPCKVALQQCQSYSMLPWNMVRVDGKYFRLCQVGKLPHSSKTTTSSLLATPIKSEPGGPMSLTQTLDLPAANRALSLWTLIPLPVTDKTIADWVNLADCGYYAEVRESGIALCRRKPRPAVFTISGMGKTPKFLTCSPGLAQIASEVLESTYGAEEDMSFSLHLGQKKALTPGETLEQASIRYPRDFFYRVRTYWKVTSKPGSLTMNKMFQAQSKVLQKVYEISTAHVPPGWNWKGIVGSQGA